MNSRVRKKMFTTAVTVFPTAEKDSAGDTSLLEPFDTFAYVFDEQVLVENELGIKELSTRQLYLPLDEVSKIKCEYKITCLDSIQARIVKRQAYRGPHSKTLIGVVYLP